MANTAGFRTNQSIVVFGAGPVGLLCMAVAKALGASRVIAVDIVPSRLEFAKSYAATETYLPPKPNEGESQLKYSERNARTMQEQLGIDERGPRAIDVVIDASGAAVSIQTAVHIARHGGTFVQVLVTPSRNGKQLTLLKVGMGNPEVTLPITQLLVKEVTLKGSFRYGVSIVPSFLHCGFLNVFFLAWRLCPCHCSCISRQD